MRLNRGTIILLLLSIVVIAAVLLLNSKPAAESTAVTPTLTAGGPLVTEFTAADVISLNVLDNASDGFTQLMREDTESEWRIAVPPGSEGEVEVEREPEQALAQGAVDRIFSMEAETGFNAENLADFGLEEPAFTLEVETAETTVVLNIGGTNPANTRYYVQRGDNASMVFLVPNPSVDPLTRLVVSPPYIPLPTATPTATATLNPLSEVEQATATAAMDATVTAVMGTLEANQTATAQVTPEATEEATPQP